MKGGRRHLCGCLACTPTIVRKRASDLRDPAPRRGNSSSLLPGLVPLLIFFSSAEKYSPARCAHTQALPKSDSAEPGVLITFPHAPPARRATGSEPGAPAPPGGGLGRGDTAPLPGWRVGENNPHPTADLDGAYPFKRNLREGGGATNWAGGGGLRSGVPSLCLQYTSRSLSLTLRLSSPSIPLFFFSFDTKVGL